MKWILATEKMPTRDWPYCVKHDGGGADYYETMLPEELSKAIEVNKKADYHVDYYWLDESTPPIRSAEEILDEKMHGGHLNLGIRERIIEAIETYHNQFKQ